MDGLVVEFGPVSASRKCVMIHGEVNIESEEDKIRIIRQIFSASRAFGILKGHDHLTEEEFKAKWAWAEEERMDNLLNALTEAENQDF